uniref:Uncharacterized protein n=1 Tax=Leersia perrieri TaxID=77586 RepID=A0A0D9Y0X5_9ORYZ
MSTNCNTSSTFIPLPEEAAMRGGCRIDDDFLDHNPSRSVSVTTSGVITLVCIDTNNRGSG